jgi:hypothetical protein
LVFLTTIKDHDHDSSFCAYAGYWRVHYRFVPYILKHIPNIELANSSGYGGGKGSDKTVGVVALTMFYLRTQKKYICIHIYFFLKIHI